MKKKAKSRRAKRALPARAQVAAPVFTGRREAGKIERRRRIIEAARSLIRQTGNAGLSMRALARKAGVSLATPYNLFGSKRAIVLAVLEDVREFQERFAHLKSTDPIERIFAAVYLALEYYKRDPKFYKTLWAAVFDADDIRADIFNYRRNAFWESLIREAINAGAIMEEADPHMLLTQFDFILRSAMFDWVVGALPQKKLTPTVFCGFALILKGICAPSRRKTLQSRILECQAKITA